MKANLFKQTLLRNISLLSDLFSVCVGLYGVYSDSSSYKPIRINAAVHTMLSLMLLAADINIDFIIRYSAQ